MKKPILLAMCAFLLICLSSPAWAGMVADGVKAKKPLTEVFTNGLVAGYAWDAMICEAIGAGADPEAVIKTAIAMNADTTLVVKGAKCGNVSDQVIRAAFGSTYGDADFAGGRSGMVTPLNPITPSYSGGGGGGGGGVIVGSPWR